MTKNLALVFLLVVAGGCNSQELTCPRVIFLDGAGWALGDGPVREGMKEANYPGPVERFGWSLLLGAPLDHAAAGPDLGATARLAERVTNLRREIPDGQIVLMGLSAGTTNIVYALEKLPADVKVDEVVLLSPSISGQTDLRPALAHVKGKMYVTVSRHDGILAFGGSSGPVSGEPAGITGFVPPFDLSRAEESLYRRVEYIPWRQEYSELGWSGGHTSVVSSKFIAAVIAPKVMPPPGTVLSGPTLVASARPAPDRTRPPEQETPRPPRPTPTPTPTPQPPVKPPTEVVKAPIPASQPTWGQGPPIARGRYDPKASEYLRMLGHGDDGDRKSAAKALKDFNFPIVIAGLVEALRTDGYEDVRREAAVSLGELKARDAQPALRQAAREDRDSAVRKAALKAAQKVEAACGIQP